MVDMAKSVQYHTFFKSIVLLLIHPPFNSAITGFVFCVIHVHVTFFGYGHNMTILSNI